MWAPRTVESNETCVEDVPLWTLQYADCHGITKHSLGTAPFIFETVRMTRPQTVVVIGSGVGVIPRILREAQIASGSGGTTYLIDLGETMGAVPQEIHNPTSLFRSMYPEIKVFQGYSVPQGLEYLKNENIASIDVLWIDGDHSYKGSKLDFDQYSPLVHPEGLIFMHDTWPYGYKPNPKKNEELVPSWCGVHQVISEIRLNPKYEVFNVVSTPKHRLGCGVAVIKQKLV